MQDTCRRTDCRDGAAPVTEEDAGSLVSHTLRIQPMPIRLDIVQHWTPAGYVTAIAREWSDSDQQRCRLCRKCVASGSRCLIVADGFLTRDRAALFSDAGYDWQADQPPSR